MAKITFTIDKAKIEEVETALAELYSIPMVADPDFIPSREHEPPNMIPEFTIKKWPRECLRRWLIKQVARYNQKKARDEIIYNEENDLIT